MSDDGLIGSVVETAIADTKLGHIVTQIDFDYFLPRNRRPTPPTFPHIMLQLGTGFANVDGDGHYFVNRTYLPTHLNTL